MTEDEKLHKETRLLQKALTASKSKYDDVLLHPLVQLFLNLKWKRIHYLFWASILIHVSINSNSNYFERQKTFIVCFQSGDLACSLFNLYC